MVEKLREALHKIIDKSRYATEHPADVYPLMCLDEIWKIAAAALILDILHDEVSPPGIGPGIQV